MKITLKNLGRANKQQIADQVIKHLLDQGVDISKIEMWHNSIDGEGHKFFDWPITEGYCETYRKSA